MTIDQFLVTSDFSSARKCHARTLPFVDAEKFVIVLKPHGVATPLQAVVLLQYLVSQNDYEPQIILAGVFSVLSV